jgi:hypothetical protein
MTSTAMCTNMHTSVHFLCTRHTKLFFTSISVRKYTERRETKATTRLVTAKIAFPLYIFTTMYTSAYKTKNANLKKKGKVD